MKQLSLILLTFLLFACGGDAFEKEKQKLIRNHELREANYQQLRDNYQMRIGDYHNVRDAHEAAMAKAYTDSLHVAINATHELLEQNHVAFFKKHDEILEQHKGLKARMDVEGYAPESIREDFIQMEKDYVKLEREFGYINAEVTQMIEEQTGMLDEFQ